MKTHFLLVLLAAILVCCRARAQGVQNQDIFLLAGPASIASRTLPGSNVTLYGQTALGTTTGYGYQVARMSAASLWLEFTAGTFVVQGLTTTSVAGLVNNDLQAYTAGVRLQVPLQSRISAYGISGGGGGLFQHAAIEGGSNPYVASHSTLHGVFLFGGGIDVRLNRRLSVRGEVRDLVTGSGLSGAAGRNHVLPLFGIAFHF